VLVAFRANELSMAPFSSSWTPSPEPPEQVQEYLDQENASPPPDAINNDEWDDRIFDTHDSPRKKYSNADLLDADDLPDMTQKNKSDMTILHSKNGDL
jgi:hypothetical protein